MFSPLSSRSIKDFKNFYTYTKPAEPGKTARNTYEQSVRNKYYN